mmetsp:Transcript_41875/g.68012  ORF Transcript_41875/g.68012 Transcript_41875/m.68012 type:complete len:276 (-) Transcript_41875:1354-2181(-)
MRGFMALPARKGCARTTAGTTVTASLNQETALATQGTSAAIVRRSSRAQVTARGHTECAWSPANAHVVTAGQDLIARKSGAQTTAPETENARLGYANAMRASVGRPAPSRAKMDACTANVSKAHAIAIRSIMAPPATSPTNVRRQHRCHAPAMACAMGSPANAHASQDTKGKLVTRACVALETVMATENVSSAAVYVSRSGRGQLAWMPLCAPETARSTGCASTQARVYVSRASKGTNASFSSRTILVLAIAATTASASVGVATALQAIMGTAAN